MLTATRTLLWQHTYLKANGSSARRAKPKNCHVSHGHGVDEGNFACTGKTLDNHAMQHNNAIPSDTDSDDEVPQRDRLESGAETDDEATGATSILSHFRSYISSTLAKLRCGTPTTPSNGPIQGTSVEDESSERCSRKHYSSTGDQNASPSLPGAYPDQDGIPHPFGEGELAVEGHHVPTQRHVEFQTLRAGTEPQTACAVEDTAKEDHQQQLEHQNEWFYAQATSFRRQWLGKRRTIPHKSHSTSKARQTHSRRARRGSLQRRRQCHRKAEEEAQARQANGEARKTARARRRKRKTAKLKKERCIVRGLSPCAPAPLKAPQRKTAAQPQYQSAAAILPWTHMLSRKHQVPGPTRVRTTRRGTKRIRTLMVAHSGGTGV